MAAACCSVAGYGSVLGGNGSVKDRERSRKHAIARLGPLCTDLRLVWAWAGGRQTIPRPDGDGSEQVSRPAHRPLDEAVPGRPAAPLLEIDLFGVDHVVLEQVLHLRAE